MRKAPALAVGKNVELDLPHPTVELAGQRLVPVVEAPNAEGL